jgi:2-desacetyl-2-hydroxyethyl bacteriochlorophyllide A dehydrogenase
MKTRRAVASSPNRVELQPYDLPPLGEHDVAIQTLYSLISQGTELATIASEGSRFRRAWSPDLRLFGEDERPDRFPAALGYSSVGRVEKVGQAVSGISEGDIIWLDRPHQETHIVSGAEASFGLCRPTVVPQRYVFRVLAKVALAGVHDAQPYLGARVGVVGLGVVGQLTAMLLRMAGASAVYGIDPSRCRQSWAIKLADAIVIDPYQADPARAIKEAGGGLDAVIEASGTSEGLNTAIRCAAIGGRVVTVSTYNGPACAVNLGEEYHRNRIELISSMSVNGCPHRGYPIWDIPRLLATTREILDNGRLEPETLITHTVPFENLPHAYAELQASSTERMGTLITYEGAKR